MARDWFRKSTWDDADQSDFEARLKRARAASRPQQVYLQGYTLMETGKPGLLRAALELAERAVSQFPPHGHVSAAQHLMGLCLERLGDAAGALRAYRAAVQTERAGRCILTDAYLDFGWLVAIGGLRDDYGEATALLDEFAARPAFPVQRFRYHSARALMAAESGSRAEAVAQARLALDAARADRSGFASHQHLGLVDDRFADIQQRLRSLAG
ncbi:MAG TPA: hypothetical protein VFD43_02995 [Planctomycetota bacterium]|nr:hypothetical protein [Planctomycetota bacterium]